MSSTTSDASPAIVVSGPAQGGDDDTNKYAQILSNFKVKDASCFAGTGGTQAKWPRLMVFSASDIPLTHDAYKKSAVMNKVLEFFSPVDF